jgi:hypothetical protein
MPSVCPVVRCAVKIRSGYLMCPDHWRRVPRELRRLVGSTWRAIKSAETREARTLAIVEYSRARDQAIASAAMTTMQEFPLLP